MPLKDIGVVVNNDESNPVKVFTTEDVKRRVEESAKPFYAPIVAKNQTFGAGTLVKALPGGVVVYPGHHFIVRSVGLSATRQLGLYFILGSGAPSGRSPFQHNMIGNIQSAVELAALPPGSSLSTIAERFDAGDGDTPFVAFGSANGVLVPKGYNKPANWIAKEQGDSNVEHSAHTSGDDTLLMSGRLRTYKTNPIQHPYIIIQAKGSANSANWRASIDNGEFDISEKTNMVRVQIGTNNIIQRWNASGGSLTQAQIEAEIAIFIADLSYGIQAHFRKNGYNVPFVYTAPPPLSNPVMEAALVQLRNAARDLIVSIGGGAWYTIASPAVFPENKVWFISFGETDSCPAVFSSADPTKYLETSGNKVHTTASAETDMWLVRFLPFLVAHQL